MVTVPQLRAEILAWSIPAAFWLSGLFFFILSRRGFESRGWAYALWLLGTGYGLTIIRMPSWSTPKALLEDLFFLLGTAAMTAALSRRFAVQKRQALQGLIMLAALASAGLAMEVYRSVRLETFSIQMGCALLLCTGLVINKRDRASKGDRVLYGTFWVVCITLVLQCIGYLTAPEAGPVVGAWSATIWGFFFQVTGGLIVISLTVSILLSISLDVIDRLHVAARTDILTGLLNRRGFEDAMAQLRRQKTALRQLALMIVDLDHFKKINDSFGHEAGDTVIVGIALLLQEAAVAGSGLAGRLGGEEFVLLLPYDKPEALIASANRIREAFSLMQWPFDTANTPRTASFGVTPIAGDEPYASAMARADALLYLAKRSGRNCVIFSDSTDAPDVPPLATLEPAISTIY